MGRLFYEKPALEKGILPPKESESENTQNTTLKYLEKVSKLVPSEIVAGYIALVGLVPNIHFEGVKPWIYLGIFVVCLFLTPVYLNLQAESGKPKRNHLFISSIAFIVWAYTISGNFIIPQYYDSAIASIVLILFSLISGVIPLDR